MIIAYIGLGSNLGNREAALHAAINLLAHLPESRLLAVAGFRETDPVDAPPGSNRFINTCLALETPLPAENLLAHLLRIERQLGRLRPPAPHDAPPADPIDHYKNAPRTIDLDLLLLGQQVLHNSTLTLPHPRMHLRRFVLDPLAEIAPNAMHPLLQQTIRQLLAALQNIPPAPQGTA